MFVVLLSPPLLAPLPSRRLLLKLPWLPRVPWVVPGQRLAAAFVLRWLGVTRLVELLLGLLAFPVALRGGTFNPRSPGLPVAHPLGVPGWLSAGCGGSRVR